MAGSTCNVFLLIDDFSRDDEGASIWRAGCHVHQLLVTAVTTPLFAWYATTASVFCDWRNDHMIGTLLFVA